MSRGSWGGRRRASPASDFSKGAYEEAQMPDKTPVALMNGEQLVALLVENDIGIQRTGYDLIDLDEDQ